LFDILRFKRVFSKPELPAESTVCQGHSLARKLKN
jgi:hypothetical protein